jgi:hypothetical protein
MPDISPSIPVVGQPNSTEEPKIVTALTQLVAAVNDVDSAQITDGAVQAADLQSTLADALGVNTGTIRRGKSIIATTEARTNTAYGLLTTPDRVSNVVVPTDGLVVVAYQATWQESVVGAANAAIFIGSNQLKIAQETGAPIVQEAVNGASSANTDRPLVTYHEGLASWAGTTSAYTGDVTTGMTIGARLSTGGSDARDRFGYCTIGNLAAGTYDISVQFKSSSGSVTAKNRKLWVWTLGF